MKFKTFLLITTLKFYTVKNEDALPQIEDLFPQISKSEIEEIKNVDIDLERIDMDKLTKRMGALEAEILGTNETRRQNIPMITRWQFKRASNNILKTKALDNALQVIYMTRHKIKLMEKEKHFNNKDTGYRIAFLYRKLRRLWRKMMDLLTMMIGKVNNWIWYTDLTLAMKMHLKVLKLYEEFQYLYWVLIALDGKNMFRQRTTTTIKTTEGEDATRGPRTRSTRARQQSVNMSNMHNVR